MNTAATRAAIKRASLQARDAIRELDASQTEALLQLYEQAAQEIRGLVAARVDANDLVPLGGLRDLLRQVEDVIGSLSTRRGELMVKGLETAASLGVQPYTVAAVTGGGGAGHAVLGSEAAMRVSKDAVRFVMEFRAADGLALSDRVWRLDQGAKETLSRAIGQAVVSGMDAQRAAAQFMYSGQPVPADVAARLASAKLPAVQRAADLLVGDQGEVWKADRVFRTEINRAHGTAYMEGAQKTPGFGGLRFVLSPLHPKADICDLLAAQNLYGLGTGVYPDAKTCPWPAHPNTLSFTEIVFADEVSAADRAGKETVTAAMGRMSPAVREGILGVEKADLYEQGLVKPWMIRSPLYTVKSRLARQERL